MGRRDIPSKLCGNSGGRQKCRWENTLKYNLKEKMYEIMDVI